MVNVSYNWERISVSKSKTGDPDLKLRHIVEKLWFVRQGIDGYNNRFDVRQVIDVPAPDPNNFTTLQQLTKEDFISWIENILGPEKLQEIDQRIATYLQTVRRRKGQPE